jgi:hypothetical protein
MTAYYPSNVKNDFSTKLNFITTVQAADVNDLQSEVSAVESNLGTNIATGSGWIGVFDKTTTNWPTLKARLANIEYGINEALLTGTPAGGTTGQVLTKSSGTDYDYAWSTINALPNQSGQAGNYLTTNGTSASWSTPEATINPLLLIGA